MRGSGVKESRWVNFGGIRWLRRGNGVAGLALRMWEWCMGCLIVKTIHIATCMDRFRWIRVLHGSVSTRQVWNRDRQVGVGCLLALWSLWRQQRRAATIFCEGVSSQGREGQLQEFVFGEEKAS